MSGNYTKSLSPWELLVSLEELRNRLSTETEKLQQLAETVVELEYKHKMEYSKEYMRIKAEGKKLTINEFEAIIYIKLDKLNYNLEMAKALYETKKKLLQTININIEAVRSQLSWLKEDLQNA